MDFINLNSQEVKLAEVSSEKRILMGALLVPNKPIYRKNSEKLMVTWLTKLDVWLIMAIWENDFQNRFSKFHEIMEIAAISKENPPGTLLFSFQDYLFISKSFYSQN